MFCCPTRSPKWWKNLRRSPSRLQVRAGNRTRCRCGTRKSPVATGTPGRKENENTRRTSNKAGPRTVRTRVPTCQPIRTEPSRTTFRHRHPSTPRIYHFGESIRTTAPARTWNHPKSRKVTSPSWRIASLRRSRGCPWSASHTLRTVCMTRISIELVAGWIIWRWNDERNFVHDFDGVSLNSSIVQSLNKQTFMVCSMRENIYMMGEGIEWIEIDFKTVAENLTVAEESEIEKCLNKAWGRAMHCAQFKRKLGSNKNSSLLQEGDKSQFHNFLFRPYDIVLKCKCGVCCDLMLTCQVTILYSCSVVDIIQCNGTYA